MRGSDTDPVVIRLRREIQQTLRNGLRAAGLADLHLVMAEMKKRARQSQVFIPERTLRRYLNERNPTGIPKEPKDATREALRLLAQMGNVEDAAMSLCEELWRHCHMKRTRGLAPSEPTEEGWIPSVWYAIIPPQDSRRYTSIDRYSVTRQERETLSGTIVRLSPPSESGLRWEFSGTRHGVEGLFLVFRPLDADNPASHGTIALQQVEYRPLRYRGTYTRLDRDSSHHRLLTREIALHPEVPLEAFRRVALLDLDNTLRGDWTIRRWMEFLSRSGSDAAKRGLPQIEDMVKLFSKGTIDHDKLARSCADIYAEAMRGELVEDFDDWAAVFVQGPDSGSLFDFVKPLVEDLAHRGVAPVIISGAPQKVVKRHARRLGIPQVFGLTLGTADEGGRRYDGTVVDNPGLGVRKRSIVRALVEQEREVVLAIGDSESDEPLWQAAPYRVIVGDRVLPDPEDANRTLIVHPGRTAWPEIAGWLDARLEVEEWLQYESESLEIDAQANGDK